eukprot:1150138-Pelagomonas_calceolata.AAC.1
MANKLLGVPWKSCQSCAQASLLFADRHFVCTTTCDVQEFPDGIPIAAKDGTYRFSFDLDWRDDESNLDKHKAVVDNLLVNEKVDFLANAQPNFAEEEALQAHHANPRIMNLHGATSNPALYERAEPNVNNLAMRRLAHVVYRRDLAELEAACKAAIEVLKAELLVVQDIPYTTSDPETLMGGAAGCYGKLREIVTRNSDLRAASSRLQNGTPALLGT